ncbi:MAG TPA: 30S ribosomal protein S20 [Ktedonobacterales bacterium]
MPNIKSAKKRVRIEAGRRLRNHSVKSATRTFVTKARSAIATDASAATTEEAVKEAISNLDRAASKGIIHPNNAARRKSRLMARLHTAQVEAAAPKATKAATKTRKSTTTKTTKTTKRS